MLKVEIKEGDRTMKYQSQNGVEYICGESGLEGLVQFISNLITKDRI